MLTNASTITNFGTIGNSGIVNIQVGAVLNNLAGSTYSQTQGQIIVDGTLNSMPAVQIGGGILSGTGTINGNVNNSGGFVQPGDAPGMLTFNGNYTQGAGGVLTIELGGAAPGDFSVLDVSRLTSLDGTLDLAAVNGFTPRTGEILPSCCLANFRVTSPRSFSRIGPVPWATPAPRLLVPIA